jgi:hypothetical protein
MKLVQYQLGHPKNTESMQRMCAVYNIEYELTFDYNRLKRDDYTIAWIPMEWICPDEFPESVYLFFGPQVFVYEQKELCGPLNPKWEKRAVFTSLSDWNYNVFYEFTDSFIFNVRPLYFGINASIEEYSSIPKTIDCVVYIKRRNKEHVAFMLETLNKKNINYKVFEYGSYKNHEYFEALRNAKFCIWVGTHESQGFCFQETLATNTPILLWDATCMFFEMNSNNIPELSRYLGSKKLVSTTANLWSDECGIKVDRSTIEESIDRMMNTYTQFKPRSFILEHASDKACMGRILSYFGLLPDISSNNTVVG